MQRLEDFRRTVDQTSDGGLLKTFAALTHRLHAADRNAFQVHLATAIRDKRDLVEAEILRRMDGRHTAPRGQCSSCGHTVRVRRDGTAFRHDEGSGGARKSLAYSDAPPLCPGSGRPPSAMV